MEPAPGHDRRGEAPPRLDSLAGLRRKAPLLVLVAFCLLAGLWAGLLRLGLDVPELHASLPADHGPLMILGFLGTLISLERAVALGQKWAFLAPLGAGLGMVVTLFGGEIPGNWLLVGAGAVLTAAAIVIFIRQPALHSAVMGGGAVSWLVGAALWLDGRTDLTTFAWLAGFLVLTVTGERLELARFTRLEPLARNLFLGASAIFGLGLLLMFADETLGARVVGVGLLALAAWLGRYDLARRTIRTSGLTRYMAACLLAGYAWLAIAGGTWIVSGAAYGWSYDAKLHTVFLGFVMSMVFGHAAVIFPAVFRVAVPYKTAFWGHLVLLHAGLAVRILGDATANRDAWQTGGVINEIAILLFIAVVGGTAFRATRARARRQGRSPNLAPGLSAHDQLPSMPPAGDFEA